MRIAHESRCTNAIISSTHREGSDFPKYIYIKTKIYPMPSVLSVQGNLA